MTGLDRSKAPEIKEFGELVMPDARHLVLDNGLPLDVVSHGNQEVCCLTCVWEKGMAEALSNTLPSLTLNMMREGTARHSGEQIADILEFNGARLFTSCDAHFSIFKLYTLNSRAAEVIPLLPEIMLEPSFPEKNFMVLREKAAKNVEIMESKVEYQATRAINRIVMGEGHPLAVADTPARIRDYTVADMKRWHETVFRPVAGSDRRGSLSLFLAGKVTPAVERAVNEVFGGIGVGKGSPQPFDIRKFEPSSGGECRIKVAGAMQSAVRMYMPVIGREHPDYITLRLLIIALGGYFGSRLMSNIREDKGYTYGINSFLLGYPEGGLMGINSSTDNTTLEPLIEETRREIARLSTGDFSPGEMERLKQYAMSTLATSLDSAFEIMDYHINGKVSFIPPGYFERQVAAIRSLTPGELARVAREHLSLDRLAVAVAGDDA